MCLSKVASAAHEGTPTVASVDRSDRAKSSRYAAIRTHAVDITFMSRTGKQVGRLVDATPDGTIWGFSP